jgi:hypothetical protein
MFCVFPGQYAPWISAKRCVMQGIEAVVIGDHDVGVVLQQQRQHVVALLGDGVVQRSVAFRVLQRIRHHVERGAGQLDILHNTTYSELLSERVQLFAVH